MGTKSVRTLQVDWNNLCADSDRAEQLLTLLTERHLAFW